MLRYLGPEVPIEVSFFRIPRFAATMGGFWPQLHLHWLTVFRFLVNSIAVAIGAFGENIYGIVNLTDLVSAMEAFCPGITKVISLLKMCLFLVYYKNFYKIVFRMREMIMQDEDMEKRKIVEQMASLANILSFILLLAGTLTNTFFNILPIAMNIYRKFQGLEMLNVLPFNIVIPEIFVSYPLYPITYCVLTLSGAMTVFTFSAVDGFFVCTCMYASSLFRMLQHDIRCTFEELRTCEYSTHLQNVKIRKHLYAIVTRHNAIIDFCTYFTAQFTLIILMHFLSAALVLCFSILDLLMNYASINALIYIFYSTAASMQLFLYCIGGQFVGDSSLAVADTLYDIEWYKCDVKTRKMILMMLHRSQKAKTIAVPFFTPSLPAFSSIISTAGSYIALFKTFL